MAELFARRVRLVVAQAAGPGDFKTFSSRVLEIEDLRVRFTVTKTSEKEPNTAEIIVSNLASATRAGFEKAGKVLLLAGYAETLAVVFAGDISVVKHHHTGADWETTIQCGDGERAIKHSRISESFPPGVTIPDVLATVAKRKGVDLGQSPKQTAGVSPGEQFTQGLALYGKASKELDKVLRARGYEWSIQDGKLQVLRPGAATTETAVELTPESGLVGSPEMGTPEKKGGRPLLTARSLLQPEIRPGRRVRVKSSHVDGVFVARKVVHTGDTAGGDWNTEIEAMQ